MARLGETLRERRTALGLSLEQVQEETRIRAKLLQALEEGQWDVLPDPGYVRGYISSYARFLELDPVPLLNMYKAETGAGRTHLVNLPQAEEAVKPIGQQHAVPWGTAVAIALVVALLSLGAWGITKFFSAREETPLVDPIVSPEETTTAETSETTTPATKQETEPAKESTSDKATEPETDSSDAEDAPQPFDLTVRVDADSASWMRITVDGKPAYEGVLTGGQSKQYEVSEKATVRLGKPESVTILRDGTPVEIQDTGNIGTVTLKAKAAGE